MAQILFLRPMRGRGGVVLHYTCKNERKISINLRITFFNTRFKIHIMIVSEGKKRQKQKVTIPEIFQKLRQTTMVDP